LAVAYATGQGPSTRCADRGSAQWPA
jgi:hypothetical protein